VLEEHTEIHSFGASREIRDHSRSTDDVGEPNEKVGLIPFRFGAKEKLYNSIHKKHS